MTPIEQVVAECRGLDIRAEVFFLVDGVMLSMDEYILSLHSAPKAVLRSMERTITDIQKMGDFLHEHRN
jgi:hypothetical protein